MIRKLTVLTVFALFTLALLVSSAPAATQTLTGTVTDEMCKKHTMMPGKSDAECIRACVRAGSKYALRAGDKLYILKGDVKQFDSFAGKQVKVTGDVSGNSVTVSSIIAAN